MCGGGVGWEGEARMRARVISNSVHQMRKLVMVGDPRRIEFGFDLGPDYTTSAMRITKLSEHSDQVDQVFT
jgi:hypothetical protein